ncbi:MAG: glycosyltransferase family 39 protein [Hyphomicrobiaceae bacterium]|nr:glycosyltransferase family 39 protein [Hyphomicrobiaceae bacterium]
MSEGGRTIVREGGGAHVGDDRTSKSERLIARLSSTPALAAGMLILLVLALHLPGLLTLPPLDRTEVIYAQTAKQMLEAGGSWTAPRFMAEPKFEKPLAVIWGQAATAWATGEVDQIRGYRIPSLLGTILAVLFTYWGARAVFGDKVALVGSSLLATMLVIAVQATLAMPESMMLAASTAAMWAVARAYVAGEDKWEGAGGRGTALAFWLALGVGVVVNVFTVALIAALTVLALVAADRGEASWLRRLWSVPGLMLFLVVAASWPVALWMGGTLDAAIGQWRQEGWHLLLGPQEMKWRVVPGLFVLFLLLGLFPAGLFLPPAVVSGWRQRTTRGVRFLFAWLLPYLVFLELLTRKTPLYMVQAMMPPLAVMFAVWLVRHRAAADDVPDRRKLWYRVATFGWLLLVVALVAALWVLPFLLKQTVSPLAVVMGLAVLVLAAATTKSMLAGERLQAALSLVAMAVAFNTLAIPVTFAGLRPVWVSSEVRDVVDGLRSCAPGRVVVAGHLEPSVVFELGSETVRTADGAKAARLWAEGGADAIAVVGVAQWPAFRARAPQAEATACVAAYDFIKNCSHRFVIVTTGRPETSRGPARPNATSASLCAPAAHHICANVAETPMVGRMCR